MTNEPTIEDSYAQEQDLIATIRKMSKNMGLFGRICFPSALKKDIPPFHHEVYKALLNPRNKRILVAAPRGTAKSTMDSLIYPLHRAAFKRPDEDVFIVIISESQSQSANFLGRIKYHLNESKEFAMLFGDLSERTSKKWTYNDIVLANGTRIVAVGTGQRLRGFIDKDERPTDIVVDDFESELNAWTPESRTKNRLWMTNAVIPSLADDGRILFVGTPISEDCYLYWAKQSKSWKVMWYQICEDIGRLTTHPDDASNLLWPDKFPASRVLEIMNEFQNIGNLNGFWQEYMCVAQNPEEAPFKPHYVRYHNYELELIHGHHCLVRRVGDKEDIVPVVLYLGCDPASSLTIVADFFVVAVLAIDAAFNIYVVDIIRGRIDPSLQPQILVDTYKRYPGRRMKIETIGYQEALRSGVRALMKERMMHIPGLENGVKSRTPKSERLFSLVPHFARGKFFFRADKDMAAVSEFMSYPRGKHDDIMDAVWIALEGAKPDREVTIDRANPNSRKKRSGVRSWKTL